MRDSRTWLTLLWLYAAGCERHSTFRPSAQATASPPKVAVFAPAPPLSPLPEEPSPAAPRAAYASLTAACDAAQAFMQRGLGVPIARRDGVTFENEFVRQQRTGCQFTTEGTFKGREADPPKGLFELFHAAGWVDDWHYSADGPDGTVLGMRSRETLCIIEFEWDGGDDTDPTYVPGNGYKAKVSCASSVPGDLSPE